MSTVEKTTTPALYVWAFWLVKWSTYISFGVIASAVGVLYWHQNKLIYPSAFPEGSRQNVPKPNEFGMNDYQDVALKAADGVNLKAYFIKKSPIARLTVIFYHANAGNMGHRLPIAKFLMDKLGCNVFMLSYRGYGHSEGEPNEKGMLLDAQAALDYVVNHDRLKGGKVILFGQSIGGAVAIATAAKNQGKVDALIVENTFTTLKDTIRSVLGPYLGLVRYFCHQRWNSVETIKTIETIPILFLSGSKDELVPPQQMKLLYKAVKDSKQVNQFVEFQNGTHNDTCIQPGYMEAIALFWKKASMGKGNVLGSS
ncbi:hypothetical protein HDV03_002141 [Kappamyces sp. JEL0829]|nr:hypothetical protein HDV03_002141 [Kappamyces sp. JEL0829]